MTLPSDLTARVALHTRADIESIEPEFPDRTTVEYLGESKPGYHLYEVAFGRLGENMLTIRHDGGRETYLEFFSTEPLETLIRKRAAFLVDKQQIRDSTKWWDGVFGPYDMRAGVTRTIEDPDIFVGRMVYVLTCDDPGLSKAPFLASKNVHFPDRREIEALEYIEHFVWGGPFLNRPPEHGREGREVSLSRPGTASRTIPLRRCVVRPSRAAFSR